MSRQCPGFGLCSCHLMTKRYFLILCESLPAFTMIILQFLIRSTVIRNKYLVHQNKQFPWVDFGGHGYNIYSFCCYLFCYSRGESKNDWIILLLTHLPLPTSLSHKLFVGSLPSPCIAIQRCCAMSEEWMMGTSMYMPDTKLIWICPQSWNQARNLKYKWIRGF